MNSRVPKLLPLAGMSFLAAWLGAVVVGLWLLVPATAHAQVPKGLNRTLQKNFSRFPLLKPKMNDFGNAADMTVTLNENAVVLHRKRYDGFRFTVERKGREAFVWACKMPQSVAMWYIVPETGKMDGFKHYYHDENWLITQGLAGDALVTGKTYLIWFEFRDKKPAKLELAFTFAEVRPDAQGFFDYTSLERALIPNDPRRVLRSIERSQ